MVPAPVGVPIGGVFRKVKRGITTLHIEWKISAIPALAQMVNATSRLSTPKPSKVEKTCDTYPHTHYP